MELVKSLTKDELKKHTKAELADLARVAEQRLIDERVAKQEAEDDCFQAVARAVEAEGVRDMFSRRNGELETEVEAYSQQLTRVRLAIGTIGRTMLPHDAQYSQHSMTASEVIKSAVSGEDFRRVLDYLTEELSPVRVPAYEDIIK